MHTALGFLRDIVIPVVVFVVLPVFFWFQRDRKKSRAETAVAERTVGTKVTSEEVVTARAGVALLNEAFGLERASKDRRIKALEEEIREVEGRCQERVAELQEEIRKRDEIIAQLEERLDKLESAR